MGKGSNEQIQFRKVGGGVQKIGNLWGRGRRNTFGLKIVLFR